IGTRDGRACLDFEDAEGTQLSLVDDEGAGAAHPWPESPVPPEHQVRGLGYSVITVPNLAPTNQFLTDAFGLRRERRYVAPGPTASDTHVFVAGDGGVHAEVHVVVRDDVPRARHGAGGVHHVALRIPSRADAPGWVAHLDGLGYGNSGIVDRHWFTSIYVREPNGVLFELATDEPGFDVDGPLDGERLALPPFLEPRRAGIEAKLKPLRAE
ncbi:MAG TPA: VOC family protein, partial [Longimicrobiales bacterium]|nr:VOC family protein [Longimicrobiales bacterium]